MPDADTNAALEIDTRFGKCAALAADVVVLPEGMPGFERCRRFVLASSPDIAPFTCVHGLDEPRPSFLAIDPHLVVDGYASPLDPASGSASTSPATNRCCGSRSCTPTATAPR